MNISVIIFSKDRAAQLDLLLTSVAHNRVDGFANNYDINILYASSNDKFYEGYEKLKNIHSQYKWCQQQDFKLDLLHILDHHTDKFVCFFVDDNILFRPPPISDIEQVWKRYDIACYSLRIGKNIKVQSIYPPHPWKWHPHIPFQNSIIWNSYRLSDQEFTNLSYAFSVDGHIYRGEFLRQILPIVPFANPNQLESIMNHQYASTISAWMASPLHSCVVNTPFNRVQNTHKNEYGNVYSISPREFNDRFLEGQRLDYSKMDFSNVYCSHQEIEPKWTNQ